MALRLYGRAQHQQSLWSNIAQLADMVPNTSNCRYGQTQHITPEVTERGNRSSAAREVYEELSLLFMSLNTATTLNSNGLKQPMHIIIIHIYSRNQARTRLTNFITKLEKVQLHMLKTVNIIESSQISRSYS